MSSDTQQRWYTIKEAAALTGLPASTLRYYESIGVISPISRGATSGHRLYDDADLNRLMSVACLSATGLSVSDMRQYVANSQLGPEAAAGQIDLLTKQQERLAAEARHLKLREKYVRLKIAYWQAIQAGDQDQAELHSAQARALADELKRNKNS